MRSKLLSNITQINLIHFVNLLNKLTQPFSALIYSRNQEQLPNPNKVFLLLYRHLCPFTNLVH